jgi:hypothetical protein
LLRKKEYVKTYDGDAHKEYIKGAIKALSDDDDDFLTYEEYKELLELFKK